MQVNTQKKFYQSHIFENYPHIVHGYSTKALGDMRNTGKRAAYARMLGLSSDSLVMAQQVHSDTVHTVDQLSKDPIPDTDGMVLPLKGRDNSGVALGIVVADCAPLLFFDRKERSIGAAHAGWKGSYKGIATNIINRMVSLGSKPEDILVSIGPRIGACCYSVPEDRAAAFLSAYDNDDRVASLKAGTWYLDIGYVNWLQLRNAGIPAENIDVSLSCTSCEYEAFYSYRKDSKETFGEIMGVIGFI